MIRFTIKNIEIEMVAKIDSMSSYNDNYYKIKPYEGDFYNFYDNDVVRITSCDDWYEETAYIGKIVDGNFVPALMITYDPEECL